MSQPKITYKYLLRFKKNSTAVWISHLDMVRTFQRIFMRAGIDLVFSEGFNPHPRIVFAVPLPLGASSECELLEFRLYQPENEKKLLDSLRASAPIGIDITSVERSERKFTDIKFASYEFSVDGDSEKLSSVVRSFMEQEEIIVNRKTKSGFKDKDIRCSIASAEIVDGKLLCILSVDADSFLGPEPFISALQAYAEQHGAAFSVGSVCRTKMLTENLIDEF